MTYELAKELKDAGFPQTRRDATINADEGDGVQPLMLPTLSELIEACGEDFDSLDKTPGHISSVKWLAKTNYGTRKPPEHGYGATPEEAVARLWLALNKKS